MRLAQKIVTVAGFVTQNEVWNEPVERRGTNFIDGVKHNCQDKIKLHAGREASCPDVFLLTARQLE
jgi:hypothetical protein